MEDIITCILSNTGYISAQFYNLYWSKTKLKEYFARY